MDKKLLPVITFVLAAVLTAGASYAIYTQAITAKQAELGVINSQLSEAKQETAGAKQDKVDLLKQMDALNKNWEDAKKQLTVIEQDRDSLQKDKYALQQENDGLQNQLDESNKNWEDTKEKVASIQKDKDSLQKQRDSLSLSLSEAQKELVAAKAQLAPPTVGTVQVSVTSGKVNAQGVPQKSS